MTGACLYRKNPCSAANHLMSRKQTRKVLRGAFEDFLKLYRGRTAGADEGLLSISRGHPRDDAVSSQVDSQDVLRMHLCCLGTFVAFSAMLHMRCYCFALLLRKSGPIGRLPLGSVSAHEHGPHMRRIAQESCHGRS